MSSNTINYVHQHLPPEVVEQLEAGAFRNLVKHLKDRSDLVPNIDLMTVSGFCRNCLAKWMVLEARQLSTRLDNQDLCKALDALGYDEAAQYVYGCDYKEWKQRHMKKATDDQMKRYKESEPLHAQHDKELLKTRAEKPKAPMEDATSHEPDLSSATLLSNVCCQDVHDTIVKPSVPVPTTRTPTNTPIVPRKTRPLPLNFVPSTPPFTIAKLQMAVLTVSDRASRNLYETGDLSGPAVKEHVVKQCRSLGADCFVTELAIVPDDAPQIQAKLKEWCNPDKKLNVVWTTGGTGFGPRDVTPEATRAVLDRECHGLMAFVTTECSRQQPLAPLSRGTVGILKDTLVVNLPGNPKGVGEIVPILLPLLLHAIDDLNKTYVTK